MDSASGVLRMLLIQSNVVRHVLIGELHPTTSPPKPPPEHFDRVPAADAETAPVAARCDVSAARAMDHATIVSAHRQVKLTDEIAQSYSGGGVGRPRARRSDRAICDAGKRRQIKRTGVWSTLSVTPG